MDLLVQFFGYFNIGTGKSSSLSIFGGKKEEVDKKRARSLDKAELLAERKRLIGSKCQTFYAADPIVVSRASMQFIYDENEKPFLDCISNVQHVGHCHPHVVGAIAAQLANSTCNLRFISPLLTECAQSLVQTLPSQLDTVLFCNSGSEANDLALQLARDWTGATDLVVLENAYHGHITTAVQMSPYKFERGANIVKPDWVHVAPAPDIYRGKYRLSDSELCDRDGLREMGQRYAEDVRHILSQNALKGRRTAAFIAEALQSCGGQVIPPQGYFSAVADAVRAQGGLIIVDEVQTGFGRVGSTFWAHQLNNEEFVPDIVTMGKPMGNGFPVAAVVTRKEIADKHCGRAEYFNTYGGNPVSCAAVLAVMEVLREERLLEHSQQMGQLFASALNGLKARHKCIGDVRGVGMFWGVDLVNSRESREPATELAAQLILKLRQESQILLNADGPHSNIIKFKPPLCFNHNDLEIVVREMDKALQELTTAKTI